MYLPITMELPPLFLVRRKLARDDPLYTHFILVTTTFVRPPISLRNYPTFNLVEGPRDILEGGHLEHVKGVYPTNQWYSIQIYRPSTRSFATIEHTTEYAFTDFLFKTLDGSTIPCLILKKPATVLPSAFYGIGTDPRCSKYSVILNDSALDEIPQLIPSTIVPSQPRHPVASAPPPSVASVPSTLPHHLVNMILEAAIEKGSSCPISFDTLTKTSARLTPCGHLVSHLAVERWLSSAHSCPVCRQELVAAALMKWVG
jgi:hypothetical protein